LFAHEQSKFAPPPGQFARNNRELPRVRRGLLRNNRELLQVRRGLLRNNRELLRAGREFAHTESEFAPRRGELLRT
jgi:hypothetical protein